MKTATLTLNPCIDRTLYFPTAFALGTLNRASGTVTGAGGKGVNAARMLGRLGARDTAAYGFAGGVTGKLLAAMLKAENIPAVLVRTAAETRTCTKLIGADGVCTEANEAGGPISGAEYAELQKRILAFAESIGKNEPRGWFFAGGSIPAGLPGSVYRELLMMLKPYPVNFVLDADGEALRLGLEGQPYLIKPNEHELAELTGADISCRVGAEKIMEAAKAARQVFLRNGCRVLCTLGADGALYTHEKGSVYVSAPKVNAVSFAGAGDTFLASFVFVMEKSGGDIDAAMRFAASAAAAKVELAGNKMPDKERIFKYLEVVETKRLGV